MFVYDLIGWFMFKISMDSRGCVRYDWLFVFKILGHEFVLNLIGQFVFDLIGSLAYALVSHATSDWFVGLLNKIVGVLR